MLKFESCLVRKRQRMFYSWCWCWWWAKL